MNNLLLAIDNHDLLLWILIGFVVVFLTVVTILLSVFLRKKKNVNEEPGDVIIIKCEEVVEEIVEVTTPEAPKKKTKASRSRKRKK